MVHVQKRLAGVLNVYTVLGPVVLLEGLEPLAGEGGGGAQVGAQLSHIEVLRLVLAISFASRKINQGHTLELLCRVALQIPKTLWL